MEQIKAELASQVATLLEGVAAEDIAVIMEYPPNEEMGDISLPCFKLSRQLRKSPQTIASELKDSLMAESAKRSGLVGRIEAKSGYLNFYMDKGELAVGRSDRYCKPESAMVRKPLEPARPWSLITPHRI